MCLPAAATDCCVDRHMRIVRVIHDLHLQSSDISCPWSTYAAHFTGPVHMYTSEPTVPEHKTIATVSRSVKQVVPSQG